MLLGHILKAAVAILRPYIVMRTLSEIRLANLRLWLVSQTITLSFDSIFNAVESRRLNIVLLGPRHLPTRTMPATSIQVFWIESMCIHHNGVRLWSKYYTAILQLFPQGAILNTETMYKHRVIYAWSIQWPILLLKILGAASSLVTTFVYGLELIVEDTMQRRSISLTMSASLLSGKYVSSYTEHRVNNKFCIALHEYFCADSLYRECAARWTVSDRETSCIYKNETARQFWARKSVMPGSQWASLASMCSIRF